MSGENPDVDLLFLDESGKPADKSFAIGGIAVRADEWQVLRDRWAAAMTEHGWPADKEAKWHGIQTGEVPPPLADALFAAISGAPSEVIPSRCVGSHAQRVGLETPNLTVGQ